MEFEGSWDRLVGEIAPSVKRAPSASQIRELLLKQLRELRVSGNRSCATEALRSFNACLALTNASGLSGVSIFRLFSENRTDIQRSLGVDRFPPIQLTEVADPKERAAIRKHAFRIIAQMPPRPDAHEVRVHTPTPLAEQAVDNTVECIQSDRFGELQRSTGEPEMELRAAWKTRVS